MPRRDAGRNTLLHHYVILLDTSPLLGEVDIFLWDREHKKNSGNGKVFLHLIQKLFLICWRASRSPGLLILWAIWAIHWNLRPRRLHCFPFNFLLGWPYRSIFLLLSVDVFDGGIEKQSCKDWTHYEWSFLIKSWERKNSIKICLRELQFRTNTTEIIKQR